MYHLAMNVLFIGNAYEDTHFDSFIWSGCSALRIASLDVIVAADCCRGVRMASDSFTVKLQRFLVPQCQAGYDCLARTMVVPFMVEGAGCPALLELMSVLRKGIVFCADVE